MVVVTVSYYLIFVQGNSYSSWPHPIVSSSNPYIYQFYPYVQTCLRLTCGWLNITPKLNTKLANYAWGTVCQNGIYL